MSESSVCLEELRVPQHSESECTVLIRRSGWLHKALRRSGHAALLLRRRQDEGPWVVHDGDTPVSDDDRARYVSFRPVDRHDSLLSRFRVCRSHFTPHHLLDFASELGDHSQCRLRRGARPRPRQICIGNGSMRSAGEKIWGARMTILFRCRR